jgi:hypothetical protein
MPPMPFRRRPRPRRRGRRLVVLAGLIGAATAFRNKKLAENEQRVQNGG